MSVRALTFSQRFRNAKTAGRPYLKVGNMIRYPLSLLKNWERDHLGG